MIAPGLVQERKEVFEDVEGRVLRPAPGSKDIPRGCYMVKKEDESELRLLLLQREIAVLAQQDAEAALTYLTAK